MKPARFVDAARSKAANGNDIVTLFWVVESTSSLSLKVKVVLKTFACS